MGEVRTAAALALIVILEFGGSTCFDGIGQGCNNDEELFVEDCMPALFPSTDMGLPLLDDVQDKEALCVQGIEAIACLETVVCHCNYGAHNPLQWSAFHDIAYLTHYLNDVAKCGEAQNEEGAGSNVRGPINQTAGIDCSQYNRSLDDLALVMTSAIDMVHLEILCRGITVCYSRFDVELAEALYNQDLPKACRATASLLDCLVSTICDCGQSNNFVMMMVIGDERELFRLSCDIVYSFPDFDYGISVHISCPVHPVHPAHNCDAGGSFFPERGAEPCECTTDSLGTPPGHLEWVFENGTVLIAGPAGDTELPLPAEVMDRAYDQTTLVCRVSHAIPVSQAVYLHLNIAYGPYTVDVQVYGGCNASGQPFAVFHCDVGEIKPLSPDMVQWIGACEDRQGGFTCQVDPRVVNTSVGCRVVNRYNNNHSVVSKRIETNITVPTTAPVQSSSPQGVHWTVVGTMSGVGFAFFLACIITFFCCRMRTRKSQERPADQPDIGSSVPRVDSSPWYEPYNWRTDSYFPPPPFPRY